LRAAGVPGGQRNGGRVTAAILWARAPECTRRGTAKGRGLSQITLSGVAVDFGGGPVFEDATFGIERGEHWGVIGRNGSGKTTLLNVITGAVEATRGTVTRAATLRFTVLDQHRDFGGAATVWDAAAVPFAGLRTLEADLARQADALGAAGEAATDDALARYDRDLERFAHEGGYTYEARVDAVLQGLGSTPRRRGRGPWTS
jgi:ATP-binding cassette, subfamily F, member 3